VAEGGGSLNGAIGEFKSQIPLCRSEFLNIGAPL
jgi:hypothetical protein